MERIKYLYDSIGNKELYIGEKITITQHSLQVAQLAHDANETIEVQLACFLHDIGHLLGLEANIDLQMEGCGIENHELIGSNFLKDIGLSKNICYIVANHVNAKRYLCAKNKLYYEKLSDASKTTLKYQGGPMTLNQMLQFEEHPLFETVLRCRKYDELGKDDLNLLDTNNIEYYSILDNLIKTDYILSQLQIHSYEKNGYLIIKNPFNNINQELLYSITYDLENLPHSTNFPWLKYYEEINKIPILSRIENFSQYHTIWNNIVHYITLIVTQLYNNTSVLFKEKINFKHSGGGGFLPHQDVTAYAHDEFAKDHISVLLAIDNCLNINQGPLEISSGRHKEGIFNNINGVIDKNINIDYLPLFVESGDLVFFSSYLPHKSNKNQSNHSRRIAYFTFNKLTEGDFYEKYYNKKRKLNNISINHDFAGKPINI